MIDYEHGQHHRARNGLEAPASGWIEELAERDGAIWGRVKMDRGGYQKNYFPRISLSFA
nr:phage protease [Bartonella vinsonii]